MLTWKITAGLILIGLAGATMIAGGDAKAQSGPQIDKLSFCQRECAGNPACLGTCGGAASKTKVKVKIPPPKPDPEPEPPAVKSWKDEVFGPSPNGGGGGGGGGGGR